MKRSVILLPFLLSGCFMYNNLKCSLQGNCPDLAIEEMTRTNELNDKAEKMITDRCIKLYGYKKGTIQYMHCLQISGSVYRIHRQYDGVEEAYRKLRNAFGEQEMACQDYGFKLHTPNYAICIKELEEDYIRQEAISASAEAQRASSRLNCRSQTILGTTYTTCN